MIADVRGSAVRDPEKDVLRTGTYARLEQDDPGRWKRLRGCTVTHRVFGSGTINNVVLPDQRNPLRVMVKFGSQEKTFYLASFGDKTKFPAVDLPDELAQALERAEEEIAQEEQRRAEAIQGRADAAAAAVVQRQEQAAALRTRQRQAEEQEESARVERAEARLQTICDSVEHDQAPTAEEIRLLLAGRQDEVLLGYYTRLYTRTNDYRALVKACTAWRDAKRPEYGLRIIDVLVDGLDLRSDSARAAICRARGGVLLDLHELASAKEWALRALEYENDNPDGNQLLGAILLEAGEVAEGALRFATARRLTSAAGVKRREQTQQAEIKRHLQALEPARRKAFAQDLWRTDPQTYSWMEAYLH